MANGPDHLSAEYGQLVEFLELYPNISIVRADGEPPDKYEIIYNLRAYILDDDGGVQIGRQHHILITLPFGYPHSAPEVRALTPLFHPAIDQESIVIEAQWRKNQSLSELVIHIAEMITGHIYATDTPVNPEAVRWYGEHKKELPLDTPATADIEWEGPMGILEDEFDPAFNLDEDIHPLDALDSHEEEIQEIRELLTSNHLHTLSKRLNELPADVWFPEREEAEHRVEIASQQAATLFAQAQEQEDDGRYGKALECAQAILALIPDEPAAKSLAQRLQQSSFITDSLTDALNDQEGLGADLQADTSPVTAPASQKKFKKWPRKPFLPEGFPLKTALLAVLGVVLLLWLGIQAMNDWSTLSRVQKGIHEGRTQLQAKEYPGAKDTLERTRQMVAGLTLLWFRESSLQREIDILLNSPELTEGAQGRVLYKGKYVDEAAARAQEALIQLEQQAQEFMASKQYDAALLNYRKALQRIETLDLPQDKKRLTGIIQTVEVEKLLNLAGLAEQQQKWEEAMELYQQTESLLQGEGAVAKQFGLELRRRLNELQVRQPLGKALAAMENDQFDTARAHLEEAQQKLAANSQSLTTQDSVQLDSARVQLEMYTILPGAKKSFESRQWRQAAAQYQRAIDLVENSRPEVRANLQVVRSKLQRTLELARLNQALEEAQIAERKKDWSAALRLENAALARIAKAEYTSDPDIAVLKRRLESQIAQHRLELDLLEKGKWLEARGFDFFRTNYPGFQESTLSAPKANFLRREGSKQIFELSSMDSSGGRPSKLVLLYAFDEKDRQWALFRE